MLSEVEVKEGNNANAIGLNAMEKKMYEHLPEFEDDLKFFDFHCRAYEKKPKGVKQAAKSLLKFVKDEVASILACEECFENSHEHGTEMAFTMPCISPHLLLWTKLDGYSFWPSKAMWVDQTQKRVNVRFFGDHTTSTVSSANCFLFSKDRPCSEIDDKGLEGYQLAMAVSLDVFDYLNTIFNVIELYEYYPTIMKCILRFYLPSGS